MFQAMEPRSIICPVCGQKETEVFFGVGFHGWLRLMDVIDPDTKTNPVICPSCKKTLMSWLNKQAKIVIDEPVKTN